MCLRCGGLGSAVRLDACKNFALQRSMQVFLVARSSRAAGTKERVQAWAARRKLLMRAAGAGASQRAAEAQSDRWHRLPCRSLATCLRITARLGRSGHPSAKVPAVPANHPMRRARCGLARSFVCGATALRSRQPPDSRKLPLPPHRPCRHCVPSCHPLSAGGS